MAKFLVSITKEYEGEEWSNVYGVITDGPTSEVGLQLDDWNTASDGNFPINTGSTTPGAPSFRGDTSMIHALVAFERQIHFDAVNFVRLFAWDGLENPEESSNFIAVPLAMTGVRENQGAGTEVPGNVAWMVAKQAANFGWRSGRSFYRLCMVDADVRAGGKRLLDWNSAASKLAYNDILSNALVASNLNLYASGGASAGTAMLGIPSYHPRNTLLEGQLRDVGAVLTLANRHPVSRQVQKGRKRPAA